MAITVITASKMNEIKNRIKTEFARRNKAEWNYNGKTGSLAEFSTDAYDFTNKPVYNGVVSSEHGKKTINLLLKVKDMPNAVLVPDEITSDLSNSVPVVDTTEMDNLLTSLETETVTAATTNCRGACTGMCVGTCGGTCTGCGSTASGGCGGCSGGCTGGCSGGCRSGCSGCDTGCLGCSGNCDSGCYQGCDGCDGCSSGCSSACSSICSGGCSGHCGSCSGGCTGSSTACGGCGNQCTGCTGTCSGQCEGSCSSGCATGCKGCVGTCSVGCYSSCDEVCQGSCSSSCSGCSSGCGTGCSGGCGSSCKSGCSGGCTGCYSSCSEACATTCSTTCFTTCSAQCYGSLTASTVVADAVTVICTITPALADVTVTLTSGTNIYSGVSNASGIATINVISAIGLNYAVTFSNPDVSMTDPNVQIDYYGVYNISAKYSPSVIYTVIIDEANSNSLTCCTYADDATGMTKGSSDWDTKPIFNKIKPCVFQNGSVNYYLNPNNYAQKADGSASVLTGGDGDVMVEFAKFAYRIYRDGTNLYVSITDNLNAVTEDSRWSFGAFSRSALGDRDFMYVGAYHGYTIDNKLRSVSGQLPTVAQTIGTFRTQAQANGTGYQQFTFYQLTALQCLYIIKYGNLDSQLALGNGYVGGSVAKASGDTNANGMYYGTTSFTQSVKFAGIEDFWGNVYDWIDGFYSDSSWHILTNYGIYNDTGSGYTDNGQGAIYNVAGNITKTQGINSNTGFIIKVGYGSDSTYYADYGSLNSAQLPYFGGSWNFGSYAGAFCLLVYSSASYAATTIGARLSYI